MSGVRIRVLGSLEVEVGGRPVALGGRRQRALLALLALYANDVVSAERLADELWGEPTPARAVKRLQVGITRLRKALAAGGATGLLLSSDTAGYTLRVKPEELDRALFERLLADGRRQLEDAEPRRAAATLRDALALWRGEPFADVAFESFAQAEIARLRELRISAIEDRVEADLTIGRHHELVPELERLVADHPLREGLCGQLMLALYRAGRQARALEVYRQARVRLTSELGLEPGPALKGLEEAILTSDPALVLAAEPPLSGDVQSCSVDERKQVSILFLDVTWAATVEGDPERLAAAMDLLAAVAADEVEARGGSLEPVVADALVAAFGAPAGLEDHAQRAGETAIALRDRLTSLFGDALSLRAGAEAGEVLVTGDPSGGFTATGAAVNISGRLAREANAGEIRIGARLAQALDGAFELRAGNGACALVRAHAAPVPTVVTGPRRTFVGRESELELLNATYERVTRAACPHFVTLVGDAGIGKTSLVGALHDRIAPAPGRWLLGRCRSYGRLNTFRPLGEIVRACLDLDADAPPEVMAGRLGGRVDLRPLLGLAPEAEQEPWEAKARLTQAWIAFLDEITQNGPISVVVEDLHWAEDPLLELLAVTAREASGPLLLLGTARPELIGRTQPWNQGNANASRIWLEALSPDEAERMLDELAGGLPPRIKDAILRPAAGNPFFVEEVLQAWIDRGVLHRSGNGSTAVDLPRRVGVPETVQSVIAARVDLLPVLEKSALQAASVVGRTFWAGAVRALLAAATPRFDLLEERDFVRRRRHSSLESEREYLFKHELTREVAYRSLPTPRRAQLHASFAGWLERRDAGSGRHAALLAHHYAQAVAPESAAIAWCQDPTVCAELRASAIRWSRRAGEQARDRHAMNDAAALFRQAAELEPDEQARAVLWRAAANASEQAFGMDGFREALEHVIELTPEGQSRAQLYSELAIRGANPATWTDPPVRETVETWIRHALELGGSDPAVRARTLIARTSLDPVVTSDAARETLEIVKCHRLDSLLGPAYRHLAHCATAAGDLEAARRWADHERALPPEVADRSERTLWYLHATMVYLRLGRIAEASRFAQEHDALATRLSPHHHVHAVGATLLTRTVVGRWEEASRLAAGVEAASVANADTLCDMNWRSLLMAALASARLGDESAARRLEELAAAIVPPHASLGQEPAYLRLLLLRDDLDSAEQVLEVDPGAYVWTDVDYGAARLDGLAAIGDHAQIEAEAPPLLRAGGYGEPFALRALGHARGDPALFGLSAARFEAMGLHWHAHETRALS